MSWKGKLLTVLLIIFSILEIFGEESFSPNLVHIFKPLLTTTLLLMLWVETKGFNAFKILSSFALVFSFLGDGFLMYKLNHLFIPGLLCFLIAQLFYIFSFRLNLKRIGQNFRFAISKKWFLGSILYYLIFMLLAVESIYSQLKFELILPVMIYGAILVFMLSAAESRRNAINKKAYYFGIAGALLFVLSDSLLAINKFVTEISYSGFYIMSTYIIAQYCLTRSAILVDVRRV